MPSFVQEILRRGSPDALQVKVWFSLVASKDFGSGGSVISGGTVKLQFKINTVNLDFVMSSQLLHNTIC